MPTLLDINTLPRGERSRTRKLQTAFLEGYREAHPDVRIVTVDLARRFNEIPAFDEWDIEAKFTMAFGDGKLDAQGAARWEALSKLTDQLHAADILLVTAPMWNFSLPWHLKRWIDCVVQPGLTFEYVNGEFRGLLGGRKAAVLTTRDGAYPPGSPLASLDHFLPYVRFILGFMGLGPISEVVAEPMALGGPEMMRNALAKAIEEARSLGRTI